MGERRTLSLSLALCLLAVVMGSVEADARRLLVTAVAAATYALVGSITAAAAAASAAAATVAVAAAAAEPHSVCLLHLNRMVDSVCFVSRVGRQTEIFEIRVLCTCVAITNHPNTHPATL